MSTEFSGDRKEPLVSPLAAIEDRFIRALLPRFPYWVRGDHLTWMTVAWSIGVVLSGWLAREDLRWLWLSSAMLVLQWFTDSFDGKLGKLRGLGLRRWGYFMDHFLDYVFMACVMGHYAFITPEPTSTLFLILVPLYGAFEVNSWLEFGATGKFRITYGFIGPTEVRLIFVAVNTAIIFTGTAWIETALPYAMAVFAIGLIGVIHVTQRRIRAQDMAEKTEPSVIARYSASADQALAALHAAGMSPVQAIKALHDGRGLSLAEAKAALHASPAWEAEAERPDSE